MDERSEVTYLTILGGVLLVIGAWLGWTSHLLWLDRFDQGRSATGTQVAWHAVRVLLHYALLAAALGVLPRQRVVVATLCITVTLVMAIDAFGLRSALRSAGRHSPDLSFGASQETVQSWSAVLGILIAATISRWQNADERRP